MRRDEKGVPERYRPLDGDRTLTARGSLVVAVAGNPSHVFRLDDRRFSAVQLILPSQ